MKSAFRLLWAAFFVLILLAIPGLAHAIAGTQPLTLKRAVELALVHSPAAGQAAADEQRALAAYFETRDQFIPQVVLGAGLGDSWGYPLSLEGAAPSLFNLTAQSSLFNMALRSGLRSARTDYQATQFASQDRQNQIIQDTALAYVELVKWQELMPNLQQQHEDASSMEKVVEERIHQGIDHPQQLTEARLVTARAKLRVAQADGAIAELRSTISQLTGVMPDSFEVVPDSVPALPSLPVETDISAKTIDSNPAVQFAQQRAEAVNFRARAEHLALWPSVDFATQYAVLAKFNNWLQFFPGPGQFQRNNASVGVVIRFPFFSAAQHARAGEADAEAVRARKDAEVSRNQVSQETLKLQRSVEQLTAAQEVSELEYELAKSDVESVEIRMNSGNATVHDAADARVQLAAKYDALQDANFQLLRARIGLLRATGELQSWVEQKK
jgi:outer membrane protein